MTYSHLYNHTVCAQQLRKTGRPIIAIWQNGYRRSGLEIHQYHTITEKKEQLTNIYDGFELHEVVKFHLLY